MMQILELNLKSIDEKLAAQDLRIKFTKEAKTFLVDNGFDPKYGARPLLRTLQRELEDPLAEYILENRFPPKTEITADFDKEKDKMVFKASKPRAGKKCDIE
jgi:ATP-dependent Clp protease ATP-binding subunit ClpC